jgi:hypothetical protein
VREERGKRRGVREERGERRGVRKNKECEVRGEWGQRGEARLEAEGRRQ